MTTRCPFAAWMPISANHTTGGRQPIRGVVPHVQVSNGSLFGFFNRPKPPGQGASADFWCSKLGELQQYVSLADQSWAQGSKQHNGNPTFVSCEFEGYPYEPMTPAQIATGGRLIAWVRSDVRAFVLQVNHDPDNGEGITPHYVFGGGHTCPGPGPREGQFSDLVAAASTGGNPFMALTDQEQAELYHSVKAMHKTNWVDDAGYGDLAWFAKQMAAALKPVNDRLAAIEKKLGV